VNRFMTDNTKATSYLLQGLQFQNHIQRRREPVQDQTVTKQRELKHILMSYFQFYTGFQLYHVQLFFQLEYEHEDSP